MHAHSVRLQVDLPDQITNLLNERALRTRGVLMSFRIGSLAGAIGILGGGDADVAVSIFSVPTAPGATHTAAGKTDATEL